MNDINKVIQDSPGGRMDDEAVAADVEGESIIVWGVSHEIRRIGRAVGAVATSKNYATISSCRT